jgi:hypothetical protein
MSESFLDTGTSLLPLLDSRGLIPPPPSSLHQRQGDIVMSSTIPLHHGNATQIAEVQHDTIASLAVFRCSGAAAQIAGTNLSVDGSEIAE